MRQADFTVLSNKNVNLDGVDLDSLKGQRVEGEDSKWWFLFIPLGWPKLESAVDDAMSKGDGDLITDAIVYTSGYHWLLFGKSSLSIEGVLLKTRGVATGAQQ